MKFKFLKSPIMLIMPAIIAISIVVIIPLIFSFYTSFTSYKLTRPDSLFNFVGLRNYERIFSNSEWWWTYLRTILFLTIAFVNLNKAISGLPHGPYTVKNLIMVIGNFQRLE